MDIVRLSKVISYALRHDPEKYNLKLSEEGWIKVDDLLNAIKQNEYDFKNIELDHIYSAVNCDTKKVRHEIRNGLIRALYGHSVYVKKETISVPPEYLYHGTILSYVGEIRLYGLKRMGRQFVHLTESIEVAEMVAKRKSSSVVILKIHSGLAYRDGIQFYKEDAVWLSEEVPFIYINELNH